MAIILQSLTLRATGRSTESPEVTNWSGSADGGLAANALRLAADGLHRSDSAQGAFLRRKKTHLGAPKAITATAHKLARIIYATLKHGQDYSDAGAEYYETQYRQRVLRAAKRRAAQLGYQLVPLASESLAPGPSPTAAVAGAD